MVRSLKIAATVYQVSEIATGDDFGSCDHRARRIQIRKSQKKRDKMLTLLHESIHAVCEEYGLSQYFRGESEELMVRSLEIGIAMLLVENKAFAKELIKTLSA